MSIPYKMLKGIFIFTVPESILFEFAVMAALCFPPVGLRLLHAPLGVNIIPNLSITTFPFLNCEQNRLFAYISGSKIQEVRKQLVEKSVDAKEHDKQYRTSSSTTLPASQRHTERQDRLAEEGKKQKKNSSPRKETHREAQLRFHARHTKKKNGKLMSSGGLSPVTYRTSASPYR
jgi:hypothetical protein